LERYICLHGHFYQPPRENPWLETIEVQDSAYPYHDWNERVTAECYGPNAASRMLDGEGHIVRIVNNYKKISFNFGPTLLDWMEHSSPDTYRAIVDADRESQKNYSGHGSAIAQAYNHMILPLANRRDKVTQVIWGIREFQCRFGRAPEGMWLPETAVDLETLNVLAEQGIRFTILSPHQASRARALGSRTWNDVAGARIDPSTVYRINLRPGRQLALFFYDGPIARALAFEGLLARGEDVADRLNSAFSDSRPWPQLVNVATDGETYGHHRSHGDMGLAYTLHYIEAKNYAALTNYGEFLEKHPPTQEVQILENSSWSCMHGVERWKANCGCCSGQRPEWSQLWRAPLRQALDWLRDEIGPLYADHGRRLLRDPWEARNDYISVILDRSCESIGRFLEKHARRELTLDERTRALKLLELQRHAMLMYTSCGWFFDELSGTETVQVIQYAGRALQLASELFGRQMETRFLQLLEEAKSNLPEHGDGRRIYEKWVRPAIIDLRKVGAHYAVSSLFEKYEQRSKIFCFDVEQEDYRQAHAGPAGLALGKVKITSEITRESARIAFGAVHLGEHHVTGGVGSLKQETYEEAARKLFEQFQHGDFAEALQTVYQYFHGGAYSLKLLFRDEQRRILRIVLESSQKRIEAAYRHIYETDAPLIHFVDSLNMPLPSGFQMAADVVLNTDLRRAFEKNNLDEELIRNLLEESHRMKVPLDGPTLEFALRRTIERLARFLRDNPSALTLLENLNRAVAQTRSLPFSVTLWEPQNIFYELSQSLYPQMREAAQKGDATAEAWTAAFRQLGENLSVRLD
jgi:alpha-amylase/alpha-mannosidase (GH57 family)